MGYSSWGRRVGHSWAINTFTSLPRLKPDLAENNACLSNAHCSLSMSWLYSLHLSYKLSNMNRVLNMSWGYSVFVRLLFFQARKKPRVRLTERNCADSFGSRHSLHELELKLGGQEIRDTGIGKFGGHHVYLFWPYLSSLCNLFQEEVCPFRGHCFVAVKGASCKESFRKAEFPGKDSWGLCEYLYTAGVSQGLWNCKDSHNCYMFLHSSSKCLGIY